MHHDEELDSPADGQGMNGLAFLEDLPEDCPPQDATPIATQLVVYRFTKSDPPTMEDFRSQRAEKPHAHFTASECVARGLSVFENLAKAKRKVKGSSLALKNRFACELTLAPGAGQISPASKDTHRTWWPLSEYPILDGCKVVP